MVIRVVNVCRCYLLYISLPRVRSLLIESAGAVRHNIAGESLRRAGPGYSAQERPDPFRIGPDIAQTHA